MSFATSPLPYSLSAPPLLVAGGFRRQFSGIFSLNWLEQKFVLGVPPSFPLHFSRMFSVPRGSYLRLSSRGWVFGSCRVLFSGALIGQYSTSRSRSSTSVLARWLFRYFGFALGEGFLAFLVLPFGLSPTPWLFTRVLKPLRKLFVA